MKWADPHCRGPIALQLSCVLVKCFTFLTLQMAHQVFTSSLWLLHLTTYHEINGHLDIYRKQTKLLLTVCVTNLTEGTLDKALPEPPTLQMRRWFIIIS